MVQRLLINKINVTWPWFGKKKLPVKQCTCILFYGLTLLQCTCNLKQVHIYKRLPAGHSINTAHNITAIDVLCMYMVALEWTGGLH